MHAILKIAATAIGIAIVTPTAATGVNESVLLAQLRNQNENMDGRREDGRRDSSPMPGQDYRRRHNERLYQANVIGVRAVLGPPERRCWTEREQVMQNQHSNNNVPGAIAGAVIGGILGHQLGGGFGRDLSTVGGAVAGGAVGANVGRGGQQVTTQNVQHCSNSPNQDRPEYWDVTYKFRGQQHRMQMTMPPGPTVTVNQRGEPRS
jgi:uncharacterized protein YcfJ